MVAELRTITIEPESDLARALAEEDGSPVRLVSNGVSFRVSRDDEDIWAGYDPAALRDAIIAAAGTLTPEEGERRKILIYQGREDGTRPIDRP